MRNEKWEVPYGPRGQKTRHGTSPILLGKEDEGVNKGRVGRLTMNVVFRLTQSVREFKRISKGIEKYVSNGTGCGGPRVGR